MFHLLQLGTNSSTSFFFFQICPMAKKKWNQRGQKQNTVGVFFKVWLILLGLIKFTAALSPACLSHPELSQVSEVCQKGRVSIGWKRIEHTGFFIPIRLFRTHLQVIVVLKEGKRRQYNSGWKSVNTASELEKATCDSVGGGEPRFIRSEVRSACGKSHFASPPRPALSSIV